MTSSVILSFLVGVAATLLYVYWNQIGTAYRNRDVISSAANLGTAASDFVDSVKAKL